MDQVTSPILDPRIFDQNLAALREVDAALADRVCQASAEIVGLEPTRTRDGLVSFRISAGDGGMSWFGRTSIPSVRAEALVGKFDAGFGNVLLPAVGQGQEITLLTERLGHHRAVFVWETQAASVALALRLHPWSQAIAAGRCVFLVCPLEQLTENLMGWLDRHPGHLCPERIMMWPWSTMPELSACRSAVQLAYQETDRRRAACLAREKAEYAGTATSDHPSPPSAAPSAPGFEIGPLALLALHAREEVWALSGSLTAAGRAAGLNVAEAIVRGPGDVHALGRLRRLREQCPQPPALAILLDCARRQVGDVCPDITRATSWVGPHVPSPSAVVEAAGPGDLVVATSSRVRDRLISSGWSRVKPPVIPLPCLVDLGSGPPSLGDRPIDVLICADLDPTDPEHYGYTLHTHVQLWRTACDLIKARVETFTEDQAEAVLARAEHKVGLRVEEAVRKAMASVLGVVVGNSILRANLAQTLVNNKVSMAVRGSGWGDLPLADIAQPIGGMAEQHRVLRMAKLVVFADVTGEVDVLPLAAAGCGAVVVARSHPRDTQPGGLATLLKSGAEMVAFQYGRELVAAIRQLLGSADLRRRISGAAWERCRAEHAPPARLKGLEAIASSCFTRGACQR
jgi:hypothetical protein